MGTGLSRRDFLRKSGSVGLGGAAGFASTASAQFPQNCGSLPFGITTEDLVHLYEGPWRGLRAVTEKKVIDVHGHSFRFEKLASSQEGEEELSERQEGIQDFTEDLIRSMNIHGIAKQCVSPPKPSWSVPWKEFWESVSRYPDRLIPFCDPRPGETRQERKAMAPEKRYGLDNPKAAAEILRARLRQGAKGIGEISPTADANGRNWIVEVAIEFDVPILAGARAGRFAQRDPSNVAEIASHYPEAKIILADAGGKTFIHAGGWQAVIIMATYGNVYLEIGGGPVEIIEAAVKHAGADRILFGSDWTYPTPKDYLPPDARDSYMHWRNLNAVALSNTTEAQKDLILYKNAARLLKLNMG